MAIHHAVSHRQGGSAVSLPRSIAQYQAKVKDDQAIIDALKAVTDIHPAIGFWGCYYRLLKMGHIGNYKCRYRVYTALKINIRRKSKRRRPERIKALIEVPAEPNKCCSMDFMHDSLYGGQEI